MRLSIIIPCWNDAAALATALERFAGLAERAEARGDELEIIIADATPAGAGCQPPGSEGNHRTIRCPEPSRGRQMNLGARVATGDTLLFQHVDTDFTAEHLRALLSELKADPDLAAGAFHRHFDARHPGLRWLEGVARVWTKRGVGLFYGDQSIFVRRRVFEELGGFADIPLMEDLDFSRRLRRVLGRRRVRLLDPPIATSARRHQERGAWRTSLQNGLFIVLYRFGVSPHRLHAWYYRRRPPGKSPSPAISCAKQNHANPSS